MFPTVGFQIITEVDSIEDSPFLEVPVIPIDASHNPPLWKYAQALLVIFFNQGNPYGGLTYESARKD
jgi:hypothetical protein